MPGKINTFLLDGVSTYDMAISKEALKLAEVISTQNKSLIEKIEAYEDIISIEVGDTSLTRVRNIERKADLRQVYVKFEGGNPTGTHKDRIAFAQCHDALRRGFDTITLATCGNYGAAVALAAQLAGVQCLIFIPASYHTKRILEMESYNARVERVEGTYEDCVEYSKKIALENEFYDANPGGINTPIQIKAYAEIAYEIYDTLRDAPRAIAVPVSNGTLLAGVYRGFVSLYKRGKTSRIPKMLAASSTKKNPIVYSYKKHFSDCVDLSPEIVKESKINEPLINWHSYDGNEALHAVYESRGSAYDVSDHKLLQYAKILKNQEGLNVLPASTAGLAALVETHLKKSMEADRYVAILTGRK